jgi:phospholipid/cholesterol/gamma-HCH transport system substrate-binding protein
VAVVVLALIAVLTLGSGGAEYSLTAKFINASQLVKGNLVQVGGRSIGKVTSIELTPDGQAAVHLDITDDGYRPLKRGTVATVRQASLSGVANRYIDLRLPPGDSPDIPDGGILESSATTTAVDLDQLFNTFDADTRKGLQRVVGGFAESYAGKGAKANEGWLYLNPSFAATSRLFRELNRDTPLLKRFIVASSKLVTDVADRRDDLAGLVDNLATTTGAIGREKAALQDAIGRLPDFMRRSNTTFVNLRAALDDLEPLIDESKPVAKKLRPFLAELRPLARDARPTLRDLSRLVRASGTDNDLIELTKAAVPLNAIATLTATRNGKERQGAFPATVDALDVATPELAYARPYAPELTGWFDDFSHSGVYDALGGSSRAALHTNAFTLVGGQLQPIPPELRQQAFQAGAQTRQLNRCPGSMERGSIWKPTPDYNCDETQVPLGP